MLNRKGEEEREVDKLELLFITQISRQIKVTILFVFFTISPSYRFLDTHPHLTPFQNARFGLIDPIGFIPQTTRFRSRQSAIE